MKQCWVTLPLCLLIVTFSSDPATAAGRVDGRQFSDPPNVVLRWNAAFLEAVRRTRMAPPFVARAAAIVHTCEYDAWTAYDHLADGTRFGGKLRRPRIERTAENKTAAVSFAAYRALVDLFPAEQTTLFDPVMAVHGYDPADNSTDLSTPAGVGNVACAAVLAFRHQDGSNQLGDLNPGAYSDYTMYTPVNDANTPLDPNRWQPLLQANGQPQVFLAPHWQRVKPFALRKASQFRPLSPAQYPDGGYQSQAQTVLDLSARLDDRLKSIALYWADGPATETPPGHWNLIAQWVSRRDHHTLDQDVKLFFLLGNALLDGSIAAWDCKVEFDYVRPISAIRFLFAGQLVEAWAGPFLETQLIDGATWRPYIATPPFAEYVSGHSTFSAASATILTLFTGSRRFGGSAIVPAGSSVTEPGAVPAQDVTLSWRSFDDAADEAGISRLLGGIHFAAANERGQAMGRRIGLQTWLKALFLFSGVMQPTT